MKQAIEGTEARLVWTPFELRPYPPPTLRPEDDYLPRVWKLSAYPRAERLEVPIKVRTVLPLLLGGRARRHRRPDWLIGLPTANCRELLRRLLEAGEPNRGYEAVSSPSSCKFRSKPLHVAGEGQRQGKLPKKTYCQ